MESMAALGRQAVSAVMCEAKLKYKPEYYVNKTAKYVSIKIVTDHLTPDQIVKVGRRLKHNPRFLKVHNGTAVRSSFRMAGDQIFTSEWKEDKVMVRFSQ
jgi:hypothetical protein